MSHGRERTCQQSDPSVGSLGDAVQFVEGSLPGPGQVSEARLATVGTTGILAAAGATQSRGGLVTPALGLRGIGGYGVARAGHGSS